VIFLLRKPTSLDTETRRHARGAQLSFAVQVVGVAVSYALQIVLARSLGTHGFGAYTLVLAWTGPLAMLAGLGFPTVALRFLPVYKERRDRRRLAGLLRASERIALVASTGLALLGSIPAVLFLEQPAPLLVGLWTLPLAVQLRIQSELARSAGRLRLAFLLPLLQQLVMLGAALAVVALTRDGLTPAGALALPALGALVVLPWQRLALRRGLRRELGLTAAPTPRYETRQWMSAGVAFLAIEASQTVLNQADALLIGALAGEKELALFAAASSTGGFAMFAMIAVGASIVPSFSRHWQAGDRQALNELAQRAVRWAFWPQLAITAVLIAGAGPLLGLFGAGFASARPALIFIFVGQLANTATGYIGTLMMLTDNQKRSARTIWLAAALNLVLVTIGIHVGGVTGAAAGTALSSLAWNLWLYRLVRRHVGICPSIVDAVLRRPALATA
jgi:O-antigen/teichoic acid export membrane protein